MVVYEDEDHGRENALKFLEIMATSDGEPPLDGVAALADIYFRIEEVNDHSGFTCKL